jgi:hypothetical protein
MTRANAPMNDYDYARLTKRLYWLALAVAFAGSCIAWAVWGRPYGAGFALGAAASIANLWIWHVIANGLAGQQSRKTAVAGVLFAGRILALFAFGYVIVRTLNVQPLAAILGLLSASFAVIVEILFELASSFRPSR